MTDQLLNILKYALLALLYLFFARVLWLQHSWYRPRSRYSSIWQHLLKQRTRSTRRSWSKG